MLQSARDAMDLLQSMEILLQSTFLSRMLSPVFFPVAFLYKVHTPTHATHKLSVLDSYVCTEELPWIQGKGQGWTSRIRHFSL